MEITNDIFIHLTRCNKAGFLYANKANLVESVDQIKHIEEKEIRAKVSELVKEYSESGDIISLDKEFKGKYSTSAKADIFIESPTGTLLIGIFYSNDEPNFIEIANLAYTCYVIEESGTVVNKVVYIKAKKNCTTEGKVVIEDLILKEYTGEIKRKYPQIKSKIDQFKTMIRHNSTPINKIENRCITPSICPFHNYCENEEFPGEKSIMKLQGVKYYRKIQLKWRKVYSIEDPLPSDFTVTEKMLKQMVAVLDNKIKCNKKIIGKWISAISDKKFIWFWDFELATSFEPLGKSTITYGKYPYLYSLYYKDLKTPSHGKIVELLESDLNSESMEKFVQGLIGNFKLNQDCKIVISGLKRANDCILNLQITYPQYKDELAKIAKRFVDIKSIFADYHYYNPKFKNSLYMKDIVPIICPGINYQGLKFKSGIQAELGYKTMISEKRPELAKDLEEYSLLDAESLMRTFEFLAKFTDEKKKK